MELSVKVGDANHNGKADVSIRFVVMGFVVVDEPFDLDGNAVQNISGLVFTVGRRLLSMVRG